MFDLKTKQDIEDFTNGCCFFGTGGVPSQIFLSNIKKCRRISL